ncbi:MAG: hypothetical protein GPJ51_06985 [Candidatus Heimdallarchaeota archaeon]|nr:hypothetical protein [Candidatus Heimdallarchaeota archaeon]
MTDESKESKFKVKYVVIPGIFVFIGGIVTGLVFIFTSLFPTIDLDRLWTGNYILFGTIGFMMFIFMPAMVIAFARKRKTVFSSLQSMKFSKIGPYAPGYKPSGIKKPRFCEYCGYEVKTSERECPDCGGPVRSIKSSYIS